MDDRGIYTDLARELIRRGHALTFVTPALRGKTSPGLFEERDHTLLRFSTVKTQKTNALGKLAYLVRYDFDLRRALRKHLALANFDLVLFSTPPIVQVRTLRALGSAGVFRYLMLKDIFPQNAVDIGLISRNGFLHRLFRKVERDFYAECDCIGCMSERNIAYLLERNPDLPKERIHLLPNSIAPERHGVVADSAGDRSARKLRIMYGGNLGKPQDIGFLIDLIRRARQLMGLEFHIVGSGTEFAWLQTFVTAERPSNLTLSSSLPKHEYDQLLATADIGLILLDHRFTIPNYPSRLLSYLEWSKPVLCIVDESTDVGQDAVDRGYGFLASSASVEAAYRTLEDIVRLPSDHLLSMGRKGRDYLEEYYTVERAAQTIERVYRTSSSAHSARSH